MQVNVVNAGSLNSIDYLLFPEQNPMNQYYIQQQLNRFNETLTGVGRKFIEASREIYDRINDADAVRIAKAAVRMAKGIFHPNTITYLNTLDTLQYAQPMMQRYIMAEPTIRQLYHQQRCDGYSDTYVDMNPGKIGEDHYDYRRVMTGIVTDTVNEAGEYDWKITHYLDEARGDERDLDFAEKVMILKTWDIVAMFANQGKDPTDVFSAK